VCYFVLGDAMAKAVYSEYLVAAVKYLVMKGITKPSEIAKRLDISKYTARDIKYKLKKRGELPEPNSLWKNRGRKPKGSKGIKKDKEVDRPKDIIDELLEILGV